MTPFGNQAGIEPASNTLVLISPFDRTLLPLSALAFEPSIQTEWETARFFIDCCCSLCTGPFLSWTERGSMSTNVFDGSITRHQFHSGPLNVIDDKDLDPDSWTSIALDRQWTRSMIPTRDRMNRADSIVAPPFVYSLRGCLPTPMGGLKSIVRNHIVSGFTCHVSRHQGCIFMAFCSNFIIFTQRIFLGCFTEM